MIMTRALTLALLALVSTGCAGSFESARAEGLRARSPAGAAGVAPSQWCQDLDAVRLDYAAWGDGLEYSVLGGTALVGGSLAGVPELSRGAKIGVAAGVLAVGIAATIVDGYERGVSEAWVRECAQ